MAVGFSGALLVIKPGSSAFNAWALLGVLSVLCGTLRDVSTRRLDVALSPLLIMLLSQLVVVSYSSGRRQLENSIIRTHQRRSPTPTVTLNSSRTIPTPSQTNP